MRIIVLALILAIVLVSTCSMAADNNAVKYNGVSTAGKIIEVYGHRAIRGLLPEQTLPGYSAALRLGVDYVDMDIAMTKDGVLVITHDLGLNPNLTRDASGHWTTQATPIYSMTYAQLREYNVGMLKPGTRYAAYFPYQLPVDACIPTLKEVVQYVKSIAGDSVGFQIEIKNDPNKPELTATPRQFAVALEQLIEEEGIGNRTEVQSFDWQCLIELSKINPAVKTAYLTDHTTEVMTDSESGTWIAGLKPRDYNYSLPQMVKSLGGHCWEPFEGDLTKDALDEAHKLGLKVVVWGWPEEEGSEYDYTAVQKMIAWQVDGIISDRADILRGMLAARGYNVPKGFYIKR